MRRQHKILVTTKLGRPDAARVAVKLEEAHDGAYADPALLGSFRYRSAGINRLDHARSQVLRIRLRHPCWPPPAGSWNQIRCGVKIPDSAFSGNALASDRESLEMKTWLPAIIFALILATIDYVPAQVYPSRPI